jgi:DNA topoisomerase-2
VIPTVLVNGAEGIGTGWSTMVPSYNPRKLVDQMRRLIRGAELEKMVNSHNNYIKNLF